MHQVLHCDIVTEFEKYKMTPLSVFAAYALKMFRKERPTSTRKYEEKLRNDPVKSRRPDLPIYGPGWFYRFNTSSITATFKRIIAVIKIRYELYQYCTEQPVVSVVLALPV